MPHRNVSVNPEVARQILTLEFQRMLDQAFGVPEISVKRPSDGTICAAIWDMLDAMRTDDHIPKLHEVIRAGDEHGWNHATLKTQYAAWKKAYSIPSQRYN